MKRLSKADETRRAELVALLNERAEKVREAIAAANLVIENEVKDAIDTYNETVAEIEAFRDERVGDMDSYFEDRSEQWQSGEAGDNYSEWKSEWENLDVDWLRHAETLDEPEMELAGEFEELPEEVSS